MTVGELREKLAWIPADTEVRIFSEDDRHNFEVEIFYNYSTTERRNLPHNAHSVDLNLIKD